MSQPLGFAGVVLFCTDTEASRGWYERVGFEYAHGYEGMHWLRLGDGVVMLHPSDSGPNGAVPEVHVKVADVDGQFRHVVAQGLTPIDHQQPGVELTGPVTMPWGTRQFELDDPDGHRWCVEEARSEG